MALEADVIKDLASNKEHPGNIKVRAMTYAKLRGKAQDKGGKLTAAEIRLVDQLEQELTEYLKSKDQKNAETFPPMSDVQNRAFEHYYAQGANRSLRLTAKASKLGESTIRHWSSKLQWMERIAVRDRERSRKILDIVDEGFIASRTRELEILLGIKETFYDRLATGEVDITISDFIRVCQEEQLVRQDLGQKAGLPKVDEEQTVKAFLAAIEAGEAPLIPEAPA